jgi:2-polyprenyl-3-methyl-5-hydroxy-6-metoxy-1,4-benzoquinol methylase
MVFGDGISWDFHVDQVLEEKEPIFKTDPDSLILKNIKQYAKGNRLLDCGCHVGRWSNFFIDAGFDYTGVDQSLKALEAAKKLNTRAKYVNSFLWDYKTDIKYDVLVFCAVLQHNQHEEKDRILANLSNIVNKDAILFFTESTMTTQTATQYTYNGWIDFAKKHGFEFIKSWHKNEFGLQDHYLFIKR